MGEDTVKVLGEEESEDEKQTKELSSSTSSWSALPPELLQLIASPLFAGDLAMFRGVCKSWQSVNVIRPLPSLLLLPLPAPRSPYLLSLMDSGTYRLFHPLYKGFHQIHIPELLDARIRYSKDGWLLLTQDRSVVFFNPFTMEKKELPDYPTYAGPFTTMCFSSPPTSSNWIVIGIDLCGNDFGIIKCGEQRWTVHDLQLQKIYALSHCNAILYKGDCYIMGCLGQVWVFPIHITNNDDARLAPILREGFPEGTYRRGFMVESDGVLMVLHVLPGEEEQVSVSMLNLNTWEWKTRTRRMKLSDQMVYVSMAASFVQKAQVRGMNNKVYFPRINVENSCLFYSLDTKTYSSFQDYSGQEPLNTKYLRNSTWIYPNFQLLKS